MAEEKYVPRLKTKYNNEVKQQLQDKFQYENVMIIPKFEDFVVNMGVGEAATHSKAIDGAVRDLRAITGQQPINYPCPQVHRYLPPARWYADRLQGYPAWRPYVGVLRSFYLLSRSPVSATSSVASPPRASTVVVTSPWASPSSSSSPRSPLRLRRSPAWYGHHFRDHRQHR